MYIIKDIYKIYVRNLKGWGHIKTHNFNTGMIIKLSLKSIKNQMKLSHKKKFSIRRSRGDEEFIKYVKTIGTRR